MRIKSKLEKPPLEVAPTTLRLALLIYSFQLRRAFFFTFPALAFTGFTHFQPKKGKLLSLDLETLTYDLDQHT